MPERKRIESIKDNSFWFAGHGKTSEGSDVDILIISEDFQGKDIFERARLTKDAEILTLKKFMVPLDIVTLTSEEFESNKSIVAEYARKGKVMYAA